MRFHLTGHPESLLAEKQTFNLGRRMAAIRPLPSFEQCPQSARMSAIRNTRTSQYPANHCHSVSRKHDVSGRPMLSSKLPIIRGHGLKTLAIQAIQCLSSENQAIVACEQLLAISSSNASGVVAFMH